MNKLLLHSLMTIGLLSTSIAKAMEPAPRIIDQSVVAELLAGIQTGSPSNKTQALVVAKRLLDYAQDDTVINEQALRGPGRSARVLVRRKLGCANAHACLRRSVLESRHVLALTLLNALVEADYRPAFRTASMATHERLYFDLFDELASEVFKKIFRHPVISTHPRTKLMAATLAFMDEPDDSLELGFRIFEEMIKTVPPELFGNAVSFALGQ